MSYHRDPCSPIHGRSTRNSLGKGLAVYHWWVLKTWYLSTIEHYATAKNNGMKTFIGKLGELEMTILSKVTAPEKKKITCLLS